MKDVSADYIAKEEASQRKPVELYKIWSGETTWHYTNGDVSVEFDDGDGTGPQIYAPATISRSGIEFDSSLDVNTMKIQFSAVTVPTVQYIAQNPVAIVWVRVSRLFRDQSPLESAVVFLGQIKDVTFNGVSVEIQIVGFEHFLKMSIPTLRYQITCNHELFDEGCGLDRDDYKIETEVTLDETETILTSADFGAFDNGYFMSGLIEFGEEKRTIVSHSGNNITIKFKILSLQSGNTVTVSPGCDGVITTCTSKFAASNILNFLGFPFIPKENPATRIPK